MLQVLWVEAGGLGELQCCILLNPHNPGPGAHTSVHYKYLESETTEEQPDKSYFSPLCQVLEKSQRGEQV